MAAWSAMLLLGCAALQAGAQTRTQNVRVQTVPSTGGDQTLVLRNNTATSTAPSDKAFSMPEARASKKANDPQAMKQWLVAFRQWQEATPDYNKYLDEKEHAYIEQKMWSDFYRYQLIKQHPHATN